MLVRLKLFPQDGIVFKWPGVCLQLLPTSCTPELKQIYRSHGRSAWFLVIWLVDSKSTFPNVVLKEVLFLCSMSNRIHVCYILLPLDPVYHTWLIWIQYDPMGSKNPDSLSSDSAQLPRFPKDWHHASHPKYRRKILKLGGGFISFLVFIPLWGNDPIWLIFSRWVETTN